MVVNAGREIAGQPYHLMRHPSGVIVADEPLVALYGVGTCSEGPMLYANKDDVEALQFLKFDILPWYLLAIFDQAEASIHASQYPKPDLWHVAGTDDRVGDMLEQADTRCIPYLQSPAMMTIMRALKVRTEADVALALGALRPGASYTRERLMAAIHGGTAVLPGWERLTFEHQEAIDRVLAPSRGALIYDEDLLRVAHLLGLSFADAERLRKAMGKGATDGPMVNKLRAAALAHGWSDREVDVIVHWFTFIQRYTFTRGHAVAMAHAAWRVARLAVHYPVHFYCGVLDHLGLGIGGGMYPTLVYVIEARRPGSMCLGHRSMGHGQASRMVLLSSADCVSCAVQ
jgi:DNA polymerase-3 subunit alpha